ncbi:ribonuclease H-like domain-containing protein, partial [Tanacetum coccineum]
FEGVTSKTAKQLEYIRNFKQEGDKTLNQAWEWYNNLLYKCPTNVINSHQKMNIFYNGLSTMNRQLLDSQGPIPGMTLAQALMAIHTMADNSQEWHDGLSSRSINNNNSTLKESLLLCDNVTEFKNKEMNQFCKRKADSKLPTTFWVKAVNTACYVQNRVLVTKPRNKTPYELFLDRKPTLGFMRPFGCPIIILNTIDHLGKFDGNADEGFFVGYSINSKAFRVFNSRTRIVEENLHIHFSENTPNIAGSGPNWLFDIDALIKSMNYKPVVGNQSNGNVGTKACDNAGKASIEMVPGKDYILLPLWPADLLFSQDSKSSPDAGFKPSSDGKKKVNGDPSKEDERDDQEKDDNVNITNNINTASDGNSTNNVNAVSSTVNATSIEVNVVGAKTSIELPNDPNVPELEDIVYLDDDGDVGAEAHMNNLDAFMPVSPIPTTRVHKDHLVEQIIGNLNSTPQTKE